VVIGGALLGYIMWDIKKKEVTPQNYVFLENGGLYWHLVDIIWIFLFPLFYLIH
jgi:cytochrome c oxidase subunit 3